MPLVFLSSSSAAAAVVVGQACKHQLLSSLQGFEGFLSSKDAARKRLQGFKAEDRLFSLSSTSSQAVMP